MKKLLILFLLLLITTSCNSTTPIPPDDDIDYSINMDTNFIINDCLEDGNNKKAKEDFSKLSSYNIYFPTIEAGLTTLYEPYEEPDLGHYDALSMIKLGELFGEKLISIL